LNLKKSLLYLFFIKKKFNWPNFFCDRSLNFLFFLKKKKNRQVLILDNFSLKIGFLKGYEYIAGASLPNLGLGFFFVNAAAGTKYVYIYNQPSLILQYSSFRNTILTISQFSRIILV